MINLIALFLIASSLVSGGFFSPPQEKNNNNNQKRGEDLIMKEANRVIMVEYERESFPSDNHSPPAPPPSPSPSPSPEPSALEEKLSMERGAMDSIKGKAKEAASVLPNMGGDNGHHYNAKELICDAYGKCKHKIAAVFGKGEEKGGNVVDKAREALETAKDTAYQKAHGVEQAGENVMEKSKEAFSKMYEKTQGVGEAGEGLVEKTKDGLHEKARKIGEAGEMVKGKLGLNNEGKESALERTKEGLKTSKETLSEQAQELKQTGKQFGEKTMENVKNLGQDVKKGHDTLLDGRDAKTKATSLFQEGGMNFSSNFQRGRKALVDAVKHSVSKEVVDPFMGAIHLLGLATAYGMSVWVTFVSSHVLAGVLPRQQFGVVQSKVYPVYFKGLVGSIGVSLLAHAIRNPHLGLKTWQAYNMLVSLGLVLLNLLCFEPLATKAMFDKMKLEKEEGRGEETVESVTATAIETTTPTATTATTTAQAGSDVVSSTRREEEREATRNRLTELNKKLKKLNSASSLLNVLTLMALTWQLVYLGRGLPVSVS